MALDASRETHVIWMRLGYLLGVNEGWLPALLSCESWLSAFLLETECVTSGRHIITWKIRGQSMVVLVLGSTRYLWYTKYTLFYIPDRSSSIPA